MMTNPTDAAGDPLPDDSEGLAPMVGEPVDVEDVEEGKGDGKGKQNEAAKIPLTE